MTKLILSKESMIRRLKPPVHAFLKQLQKKWLLPLISLPVLAWSMRSPQPETAPETVSPEKTNLALRRTADGLLRASGDSTTRIPAIDKVGENVWRVRLERPFLYEKLPALLQNSLDLHEIRQPYSVAIRRCDDAAIDLGYHQFDFLKNKNAPIDSLVLSGEKVPCGGREMPTGCHFIEITFLGKTGKSPFWPSKTAVSLLIWGGLAGFWISRWKKPMAAAPEIPAPETSETSETDWLRFGNSRLDAAGQILFCGSVRQNLTFREAKLLRLFASNPDQLLDRDFILQQVWADEGILVGRSVDMFVSRLRKKLSADPSLGIVAIHGVGYRLETGKVLGE